MRYAALACGLVLAAVFTTSAASKLRSRSSFSLFVITTRTLLPAGQTWARQIAVVVVTTEVVIPPVLAIAPIIGFTVAAALLAAFAVTIRTAIRKGVSAPCRCFGAGSSPVGYQHVLRSAFLGGLAVFGGAASVATTVLAVDGLHPGGVAVALVSAAVLAALAIFFDDVADLFVSAASPSGPGRQG